MSITANQTIRELARTIPGSARVFEEYGIDYCCGGGRNLQEVCSERQLSPERVLQALSAVSEQSTPDEVDWNRRPLFALIDHILKTHHATVRREVPRLRALIGKMCEAHGSKRPEFVAVRELIQDLGSELEGHIEKEEVVLFPYISSLESALESGAPLPHSCFASVRNPIAMMVKEHDDAGGLLERIQARLVNRTGCATCLEFFRTFDEFEADLHRHIHLENNILFPRAVELEQRVDE